MELYAEGLKLTCTEKGEYIYESYEEHPYPSSVQECYDAIERGGLVTLYDGATITRNAQGGYVYMPSSIVAMPSQRLESFDLDSLLAHIVLRDAQVTPVIVEEGP